MTLRLYLDEHIPAEVAVLGRDDGLDILSTQEAGRANQRISDDEQLEFAAVNGRAILTFNAADFDPIARTWAAEGKEHYGIIVSQVKPAWLLVAGLRKLAQVYGETGLRNLYLRLPYD